MSYCSEPYRHSADLVKKIRAETADVRVVEISIRELRELRKRSGRMRVQNVESIRAYGEGIEYALERLRLTGLM